MKYDAFVCHASEDKDEVARPLAEALRTHGLNVWYDEFSLHTGDSLSEKIDYGLTHSGYGIIIVSRKLFEKNWPQTEFNALNTKQVNMKKRIILPIW
ncbi:MAG: TIR domain-containing protein, partial [Nitrososphaera sp.]